MENSIKRQVEAYLFIISKGLKIYELAEKVGDSEINVKSAIDELREEYEKEKRAFNIINFADTYRLTVDRTLINGLTELIPTEFNKSIIKTLSVIAWKNGISQGEVVRIRGNKSYTHIKQLLEYDFIKAEPFGKTFKLSLSNKFFEYFNIKKGEEKSIFKILNKE